MLNPTFLTTKDILSIHRQEINRAGGEPNIREPESIEACTEAPKATFGGEYLNTLFEMAATYISCLTIRHSFVDGNKRMALASALTFLYLNGYEVEEMNDLELSDLVLEFLTTGLTKEEVAKHLEERASKL
jgi:death-on-curing protein